MPTDTARLRDALTETAATPDRPWSANPFVGAALAGG
jgi:hypothetical protein